MTVECEFCGRVRVDGEWTWLEIPADVVGCCAPCGELRKKRELLTLRRSLRKVSEKANKGLLPKVADPFKGFRGE